MKQAPLIMLLCSLMLITGQSLPVMYYHAESRMPDSFEDVEARIPSILLDMRYYGPHNFIGERIAGYNAPKCLLTKEAAAALAGVQKELEAQSLSLKVYDCYRPQRAVDHFVRWAQDMNDTKTKKEFYPTIKKRDLLRKAYIGTRSGHSRGSSVDLTIVPLPASGEPTYQPGDTLHECYLPAGKRFQDSSLDMGTGFDCFHELSHTTNWKTGKKQMRNRLLLKNIMEKHGFKSYAREWWHFTLRREPFPKTYFDFAVE
jgi:D-alanyl-D-alanine dipeptidase